MKAAPDAQRRLLDLQAVDTTIAQLTHRVRQLPEHALIQAAQARRLALHEEVVALRTRVSDLQAEQQRAEGDLRPVRDRLARDQKRVADGSVTDPKQLRSLLEEIDHLTTRIATLEDAELEVMERLEASQGQLDEASGRKAAEEEVLRGLLRERDAKTADLDADLAQRRREREVIAEVLPADLLAAYTKTAERSGTGAALLQHGRCGGCQLSLNTGELARVRAAEPDAVVRCEECNRILVRTAESGL